MAEPVKEADAGPPPKRARYAGLPVPSNQAPAAAAEGTDTAAAINLPPGLQLPANAAQLLPHLQRLFSMYKVEYWSLLEELRSHHQAFSGDGGQRSALTQDAARALSGPTAADSADGSIRHIMHAVREARAQQQSQQGPVAQHSGAITAGTTQQQQQQQQNQHPLMAAAPDASCLGAESLPQPQQLTNEEARAAAHGGESAAQVYAADASTPAAQQAPIYGDDAVGWGSDDEPEAFTDAEDAVMVSGSISQAAAAEVLSGRRSRFAAARSGVMELERLASAVSAQFLDAQGALACLCGRNGRYLLRRIVCSIGRGSDSKGEVDVDLAREGPAAKVSRCQAQLSLQDNGVWRLRNAGRRTMVVNDVQLAQGEVADLPHLSTIEVGGIRLLFLVNPAAVKRVLARSLSLDI